MSRAPLPPGRGTARRSTCSSPVSATPAPSTRVTATTSAGWSSTSSPAGTTGRSRAKFSGRLADVRLGDAKLALLKPETYMNESGASIQAAAALLQGPAGQVLVVHDDVDLDDGTPAGAARRRPRRPQRASLDRAALGTQDFLRLRVGVGRPGRGDPRPVADYVLSPFAPEDDVDAIVGRACRRRRGCSSRTGSTRRSAASTEATRESQRTGSGPAETTPVHDRVVERVPTARPARIASPASILASSAPWAVAEATGGADRSAPAAHSRHRVGTHA